MMKYFLLVKTLGVGAISPSPQNVNALESWFWARSESLAITYNSLVNMSSLHVIASLTRSLNFIHNQSSKFNKEVFRN